MLFAVDSYEELIQIPGIAETTLSPFQASSIVRSELPTPSPDGFVGNNDAAFREKIFQSRKLKLRKIPRVGSGEYFRLFYLVSNLSSCVRLSDHRSMQASSCRTRTVRANMLPSKGNRRVSQREHGIVGQRRFDGRPHCTDRCETCEMGFRHTIKWPSRLLAPSHLL